MRKSASYTVLPAVRMTELQDRLETDSGIVEDRGSDSTGSDSNSVGSDSHSSTSSLAAEETNAGMEPGKERNGTETEEVEPRMEVYRKTTLITRIRHSRKLETILTLFIQKVLLLTLARGVMLPQTLRYSFVTNNALRTILRWLTRLLPVALFIAILVSMSGAMSQLQPTDHPPQFFDPDSNIQRMLDLEGNLTDREVVNCWNCSAWYSGGTLAKIFLNLRLIYI